MDGLLVMQRFALIHDGNAQGWRTAYLAFHIAAQLGAPLQVFLIDSGTDKETTTQRLKQIKVGGRAAGVSIETSVATDPSPDTITKNVSVVNGLFIPNNLVPDQDMAARLLKAVHCPLWIVSEETKAREMVVLVEDPLKDNDMIKYAAMLSIRMEEPLTGLISSHSLPIPNPNGEDLTWMQIQNFSLPEVNSALTRLQADLLFLRLSNFSLVPRLSCTCVVYPTSVDT